MLLLWKSIADTLLISSAIAISTQVTDSDSQSRNLPSVISKILIYTVTKF